MFIRNIKKIHIVRSIDCIMRYFEIDSESWFILSFEMKSQQSHHSIICVRSQEKSNNIINPVKMSYDFYITRFIVLFSGLKNLSNIAKCSYYGVATSWNARKKRLVGASLLHKAFQILLIEGERQIRPADVRSPAELPSFLSWNGLMFYTFLLSIT